MKIKTNDIYSAPAMDKYLELIRKASKQERNSEDCESDDSSASFTDIIDAFTCHIKETRQSRWENYYQKTIQINENVAEDQIAVFKFDDSEDDTAEEPNRIALQNIPKQNDIKKSRNTQRSHEDPKRKTRSSLSKDNTVSNSNEIENNLKHSSIEVNKEVMQKQCGISCTDPYEYRKSQQKSAIRTVIKPPCYCRYSKLSKHKWSSNVKKLNKRRINQLFTSESPSSITSSIAQKTIELNQSNEFNTSQSEKLSRIIAPSDLYEINIFSVKSCDSKAIYTDNISDNVEININKDMDFQKSNIEKRDSGKRSKRNIKNGRNKISKNIVKQDVNIQKSDTRKCVAKFIDSTVGEHTPRRYNIRSSILSSVSENKSLLFNRKSDNKHSELKFKIWENGSLPAEDKKSGNELYEPGSQKGRKPIKDRSVPKNKKSLKSNIQKSEIESLEHNSQKSEKQSSESVKKTSESNIPKSENKSLKRNSQKSKNKLSEDKIQKSKINSLEPNSQKSVKKTSEPNIRKSETKSLKQNSQKYENKLSEPKIQKSEYNSSDLNSQKSVKKTSGPNIQKSENKSLKHNSQKSENISEPKIQKSENKSPESNTQKSENEPLEQKTSMEYENMVRTPKSTGMRYSTRSAAKKNKYIALQSSCKENDSRSSNSLTTSALVASNSSTAKSYDIMSKKILRVSVTNCLDFNKQTIQRNLNNHVTNSTRNMRVAENNLRRRVKRTDRNGVLSQKFAPTDLMFIYDYPVKEELMEGINYMKINVKRRKLTGELILTITMNGKKYEFKTDNKHDFFVYTLFVCKEIQKSVR